MVGQFADLVPIVDSYGYFHDFVTLKSYLGLNVDHFHDYLTTPIVDFLILYIQISNFISQIQNVILVRDFKD